MNRFMDFHFIVWIIVLDTVALGAVFALICGAVE